MKKSKSIGWWSVFFCLFMTSCARPDIKLIGKDLGVTIPRHYKLLKADSDPFGLGADADQTFIFEFDSMSCRQLEKEIVNTPLFNCADVIEFDSLGMSQK